VIGSWLVDENFAMRDSFTRILVLFVLLSALLPAIRVKSVFAADAPSKVTIKWDKVTNVSNTCATLQVVVNPLLRRGSPIHDRAFQALRDLKADYVRYVPWMPYPRLGVAALEPPADGKTSWDFSLIDPLTTDFLEATKGHPVVLNFSTIPQWMFKTDYHVDYPRDPDEPVWNYTQGAELRDASMKELGDYYARLVEWYTRGGFTDEYGKRHESGHHYKIDYWEVFNEPDYEHNMTAEQYTARYDAVVSAVRRVAPDMKFVGISLATPSQQPAFFEYFLDAKHHRPGIPLDMISYHFYAKPTPDQPLDTHPYTFFDQADQFVNIVRYIEAIRLRLSPKTRTTLNEIGSILPDDINQGLPGMTYRTAAYWNLSGAMFAYLYMKLAPLGIDVLGESQLVGYPSQFPSVTMVDWATGQPNARFRALKLLRDHFEPPVKMVESAVDTPFVEAQGFVTRNGERKLLLINKRDRNFELELADATGAQMEAVDQTNATSPATVTKINGNRITLRGLAVAVVTWPRQS
jgi:hypothetical protein